MVWNKIKQIASNVGSKIKETVSNVGSTIQSAYKKADTKVGGYLPGGSTPKEVKATKTSTSSSSQTPNAASTSATSVKSTAQNVMSMAGSAIDKLKSVYDKINNPLGLVNGKTPDIQGTPEQRQAEVTRLQTEIQMQRDKLASGDKYQFLMPRETIIAQAEADMARILAGGVMTEGTKVLAGIAPIIGFPGAAATAPYLASAGKLITSSTKAGTAGKIAVNSVNAAKTSSWLAGIAGTLKSPQVVISGIMSAIGSYPFAGFIKEEALQTIGFATKTAMDNDDLIGAAQSLEQTKEILDPNLWNKILAAVPFTNVLASLKDFYDAAKTKMEIDERNFEQKLIELEEGYKPSKAILDKRAEEQAYWEEIARQRQLAKEQERADDEAYWDNILRNKYKEDSDKAKETLGSGYQQYETTKSKLNFGLLK